MSRADFSIAYDGPVLQDGTMDVRDLAPALLAVGQFFDSANRVLNGDRASIRVNVVATNDGSFEVLLGLDQSLIDQAFDFLASDDITAAIHLKELLAGAVCSGIFVGGIITYLKRTKRRRPDKLENLENGRTRVTIQGSVFEVLQDVVRLCQDDSIRKSLQKLRLNS